MVSLEQVRHLQTSEGTQLIGEVRDVAPTPATAISIATRLRKSYPADLVIAAMEMHDLRVRARAKFSRTGEMWFTRDGLEQATSEAIANYRANRFADSLEIVDLCCGIGGDLLALAGQAPRAQIMAVDRDPLHLHIAALNAEVTGIGSRAHFVEADVRDVALGDHPAIFIDPARRSDRGRMSLGESEPPLEWCIGLADADRAVGVKCAPGLDHGRVPDGWEFESIALGTDLKEAVLWSPAVAKSRASATVIEGGMVHNLTPVPGDPVPIRIPAEGETLLDPNPAVTRSGLVEDLARTIGAVKIDDRIGFLLSPEPIATPFARSLRVVDSLPWNERLLRTRLRELGAGAIDIRRRGLAGDVDAITKRLRGKRREGRQPYTIAMTRVMDQPWALICTSI
ncbi:MAG: class I SAM-dependent methyltransferase [Chloroflexota bacterium]|nr:class I SAM-dependent methyltransferase [Chloroflexota bacterium]